MPSEYYLEINAKKGGKVKGETQSTNCPEQIEIKKFTISLSSPGGVDESGEVVATGRLHLEEAEFEFLSSMASVALFQTICNNDQIKDATLSCLKAGHNGKTGIFLQWRFHDARIVSFKMAGEEGGGIPTDTLRIAYSGIEIGYKKQKSDGSLPATGQTAAYGASDNAMIKPTLT